ncbi:hypothetical protein FM107_01020 [Sphingobacterium sp. JB170]|nr:hypothetical protein FM107_01020 [Sphingobacterium sp. JB170]
MITTFEQELLSLLLPCGLTEHFELTHVEKMADGHQLYEVRGRKEHY